MTARVLAGVPIKGYRFPPNTAWFKWASDNGCLPTEEEGMGEAEDAVGMRDEVGQEGDEVVGACTDTAAAEHKVRWDPECFNKIHQTESLAFVEIITVLL